ncbi:uncharacterized protein LOC132256497 [Phlebotomus argentipes]|uniref:uncharacterized protein LOC132256497 n=1 Tax=Phlebotomus argentipes TaxID=94469 RepID=UPI0028933AD2|nr:uncharacterized protein LOC132256497 [Phlebotomus argentipes]
MTFSIGCFTALLLLSSFAESIHVNHDFRDILQLQGFIRSALESDKSFFENLFNHHLISVNVNNMVINEMTSILRSGETRKDKVLLRTGVFIIKNTGNSQVEAQSQSYAYKKTHTESVSIANTKGLTGAIKFPVIDNFSPTLSFSNTETTTQTESVEELVTIPPQKVLLNPKKQKKVNYNLYREELEQKYTLEFTVDPSSSFTVTRSYSVPAGSHPATTSETLNLVAFLRKRHENGKGFNNSNYIKYDYNTNKLMIKNYTAVRNVVNDIVEVTFGDEEPLN